MEFIYEHPMDEFAKIFSSKISLCSNETQMVRKSKLRLLLSKEIIKTAQKFSNETS